jgi:hypothetical protein
MDLSGVVGHMAGLSFNTADFDGDAGSGSMTNIQNSIDNLLQFHMNEAAGIVPDARDYLRPWRTRLRTILKNESDNLTSFLEKPLEDTSIVQRHENFIKALGMPMVNTNSTWLKEKAEPMFTQTDILTELEADLGVPLDKIRDNLHKVMDTYLETLQEMFRSIEIFNMKIDKVEKMKTRLLTIPIDDDETEEVLNLKQSVIGYVRAEYERNKIEVEYRSFCKHYARFSALRSVLTSLSVSVNSADGPICSICTTEKVCWALVPCGHTFCNGCAQKQRSQCFVCRTTLRDRQRLYFI